MNTTRLWSTVVAAAAAAWLMAVAAAGIADATVDDYINDLERSGIVGPREQLVQVGREACAQVPRATAVDTIAQKSRLSADRASFIYDSAKQFLCITG